MNNNSTKKLIRITTVPMALRYLLPGQMNFMRENGFDVLMISADGKELPEIIMNEKCRHTVVPMTRKITPFQDLKCLFQLIRIIRKEKPDIVHTHTPKAGLLGMLAARICGVKTRVHTVGGLPMMVEKKWKFKLLSLIEKIIYASANNVWPNSNSLLQYISENKLTSSKKLKIIGKGSSYGINIQKFNPGNIDLEKLSFIKNQINFNPNNVYLLYTGRLVKDKGIVELINVFTSIQKKIDSLKLLLVGDFEESLDPLPAWVLEEININPSIIHIRWTNDVEYYMHLAHTFVFPSHREGFPNVLLQAGAMNLPIICSRITGNIDIVHNNHTGWVFDVNDEKQMSSLILQAIEHKDKMVEMAGRLRTIICSEYQRTRIWQKILQQYSLIEAQTPAARLHWQHILSEILMIGKRLAMPWESLSFNMKEEILPDKMN